MGIFNRFKKKQKGFDLDALLANQDLTKAIITIDERLNQASEYGRRIDNLTEPQKTFLFVENLEREVNNGGFDQFFWNSSGNFAHETVEALENINAKSAAKILKKANAVWPDKNVPKNRMERQETQLLYEKKINPELEKLDAQFYKYPDNISELLISYVKRHSDDFK